MFSYDIKRIIKKHLHPLYKIYYWIYFLYCKKYPKKVINTRYKHRYGRPIDWNNPKEMNEKIIWMQFNGDTSKWSELADKYKAREYLKNKGYKDILVPLLGVWANASDIDFNSLPCSFVLKTNHGYGDVIIVKDKSTINKEFVRHKIQSALQQTFGITTIEPHYTLIKPLIIAEQILNQHSCHSTSLIDYKFYCAGGEPICCGVFYDRDPLTHAANSTFYDLTWARHDEWKSTIIKSQSKDIPKPVNLNRMISICKDLSHNFPFVRLDFYEVDNKLYFSEFTFTPAAYTGKTLSDEICELISEKIILPKKEII